MWGICRMRVWVLHVCSEHPDAPACGAGKWGWDPGRGASCVKAPQGTSQTSMCLWPWRHLCVCSAGDVLRQPGWSAVSVSLACACVPSPVRPWDTDSAPPVAEPANLTTLSTPNTHHIASDNPSTVPLSLETKAEMQQSFVQQRARKRKPDLICRKGTKLKGRKLKLSFTFYPQNHVKCPSTQQVESDVCLWPHHFFSGCLTKKAFFRLSRH